MYEKNTTMFELYNLNIREVDTSTLTDAEKEDEYFERQSEAFYNAIDKYFTEHPISTGTVDINYDVATYNDALEFSTSTDAKLYTVGVVGSAPTSSAQQTTTYLLDTRNILLIFALSWLCITLYSKIKNLIINYTTKD